MKEPAKQLLVSKPRQTVAALDGTGKRDGYSRVAPGKFGNRSPVHLGNIGKTLPNQSFSHPAGCRLHLENLRSLGLVLANVVFDGENARLAFGPGRNLH